MSLRCIAQPDGNCIQIGFILFFHGGASTLDYKERGFYTSKMLYVGCFKVKHVFLFLKKERKEGRDKERERENVLTFPLAVKFYHFRISEA